MVWLNDQRSQTISRKADTRCTGKLQVTFSHRSQIVLITLQHAAIGRFWYGIYMWGHLVALFAPVHLHNGLCVDWQVLVRVHHHTEQPWICLKNDTNRSVYVDLPRSISTTASFSSIIKKKSNLASKTFPKCMFFWKLTEKHSKPCFYQSVWLQGIQTKRKTSDLIYK